MEVFDNYAKYYNLLYKDKDYIAEANYILRLIKKFSPNKRTILELGCGTGKHAKLLEQKGYDVFGIDLSEIMLEQAKSIGVKCALQDCRTFRVDKNFDIVLSLFHVASYQATENDINDYFDTAAYHLEKGGVFIFDLWYEPAVLAQIPEKRVKKLENEELEIVRYCAPIHIPEKSIVEINYEVNIKNKFNNQEEIIKEKHVMRYFSKEEVINFAIKSGFRIIHSEEWMTGENPSEKTWGVCFIGEKK